MSSGEFKLLQQEPRSAKILSEESGVKFVDFQAAGASPESQQQHAPGACLPQYKAQAPYWLPPLPEHAPSSPGSYFSYTTRYRPGGLTQITPTGHGPILVGRTFLETNQGPKYSKLRSRK